VRIDPESIRKKGKVPKNGSIVFTIFQPFMCGPGRQPLLRRLSAGLLRLHRHRRVPPGGANNEGNWRGIMDYFAPAVQLALPPRPSARTTPTPTPISASRCTSTRSRRASTTAS
jgi:type I restriction enzyme R subunit